MKEAKEIYQEMLDLYAKETGMHLVEGCDLAVRLYAVAAQVEGLHAQGDWVARQCFPQTAHGMYLDNHAQLRGLVRKDATQAMGTLRFYTSEPQIVDRVIPMGAVAMTAGLVRFETVEQRMLLAGDSFVDVAARAIEAGVAGNVPSMAVITMSVAPTGIATCSNAEAFLGGADAEGDEALRGRILDNFRRLPNGANVAYYEQEAMGFDGVSAVRVMPRHRGVGTVDVVVATADGLPNLVMLNEIEEYFASRREIAVDVVVRMPSTTAVDIAVSIEVAAGHTLAEATAQVNAKLAQWFSGERLGQAVLMAQIGNLMFSCPAVFNYTLKQPTVDIAMAVDCLPILGTVTVEEMT